MGSKGHQAMFAAINERWIIHSLTWIKKAENLKLDIVLSKSIP
jgi:hypothetical protein